MGNNVGTVSKTIKSNRNKCCIEIYIVLINNRLSYCRTETNVVLKYAIASKGKVIFYGRTETNVVLKFSFTSYNNNTYFSRTETNVVLKFYYI